MNIFILLATVLFAVPALATPLDPLAQVMPASTYELSTTDPTCSFTASCQLSGSFAFDPAQANPFTDWHFQSDLLANATWNTSDGGFYAPLTRSLLVTDAQNLTLTYQLCFQLCSDLPNTYAMNIYDNNRLLRYSGGGMFATSLDPPSQQQQSVPEPRTFWPMLAGVVGVLMLAGRYARRT